MRSKTVLDLPREDGSPEKIAEVGLENLSTTELLAIVLSSGTRETSALDIARSLIRTYDGRLDMLFSADVEDLKRHKGIGDVKAIQLKSCFELSKRMHLSQLKKGQDFYFRTADEIANYFMPMLRFQKQEYLMCVYLNRRGKMLRSETISVGNIEESTFFPREIFKGAVSLSASTIAVIHNHPSGDPTPSEDDITVTKRLKNAGEILGIPIMDHIIVGDGKFCSMKQRELM